MKAYLDLLDIQRMEQAATCLRDRLLIRLLARLGCRVSEILGTKTDEVDIEGKTITILHLKRNFKLACPMCKVCLSKKSQFCPGCGHSVRTVVTRQQERRRVRVLPIDDSSLEMLKIYLYEMGVTLEGSAVPLFRINRHRAWQIVRDCARRAGIPNLMNPETGRPRGVSPHRLRDAFSVNAMKVNDSGDGLRLLQEHLGHASFNTTARYRKIAGEEHRKWYDSLWKGWS